MCQRVGGGRRRGTESGTEGVQVRHPGAGTGANTTCPLLAGPYAVLLLFASILPVAKSYQKFVLFFSGLLYANVTM